MKVTLLDLQTGKTAVHPHDTSDFQWTESNYSCDCNRGIAFDPDWVGKFDWVCLGCNRFVAIDVEGDLEGYPKQALIAEMNREYPPFERQLG